MMIGIPRMQLRTTRMRKRERVGRLVKLAVCPFVPLYSRGSVTYSVRVRYIAAKKKKKKNKGKKKKKAAGGGASKQTEPPSIGLSKLFPDGQ
jgi:hypothetical protein